MQLQKLDIPMDGFRKLPIRIDSLLRNGDRHVIEIPRVEKIELDGLNESLQQLRIDLRQNLDTLRMHLPLIINGRRIAASH